MKVSLNGIWKFLPVGMDDGRNWAQVDLNYTTKMLPEKYWFEINVPSFWAGGGYFNAYGKDVYLLGNPPSPFPSLSGIAWYRKKIGLPSFNPAIGERVFFHFDGIMCGAEFYLNGTFIGEHIGSYTEFEVEGTAAVRWDEENILAIKVKSIENYFKKEGGFFKAYTSPGSTRKGGGIWKRCYCEIRPIYHLSKTLIDTDLSGFRVRSCVDRDLPGNTCILWELKEENKTLPLLKGEQIIENGKGIFFRVECPDAKPWSPESPDLYDLSLELITSACKCRHNFKIGFRTFSIENEKFLLNGRPYAIFGVSHPPDHLIPDDRTYIRKFLGFLKEAGVRLITWSEEPAPVAWLEEMDRIGILSLELSAMQWRTPVIDIAVRELKEFVYQQYNHPCVVAWAIGHECSYQEHFDAAGHPPPHNTLKGYFGTLYDVIRNIDPARPILNDYHTSATVVGGDFDSLTTYTGWYFRTVKSLETCFGTGTFDDLVPEEGLPPFPFADNNTSGKFASRRRPLIFTEPVGAYSDPEDGHLLQAAVRMRRIGPTKHLPKETIKTISQEFKADFAKTTLETMRAMRKEYPFVAGFVAFKVGNWFYHPLDTMRIEPKPILKAFSKAVSSILIYPMLEERHACPGDELRLKTRIIHDDLNLPFIANISLAVTLQDAKNNVFKLSETNISNIPYYGVGEVSIPIRIPKICSEGFAALTVTGTLPGKSQYANSVSFHILPKYSMTNLCGTSLVSCIALFEPQETFGPILGTLCPDANVRILKDCRQLEKNDCPLAMAFAPNSLLELDDKAGDVIFNWLSRGGRALVMEQDAPLENYPRRNFPDPTSGILVDWFGGPKLKIVREYPDHNVNLFDYDDVVFLTEPGHPIFDGLRPEHFSCFNGNHVVISSYIQVVGTRRYVPRGNPDKYYRIEPDPRVRSLAKSHYFLRDEAICQVDVGKGSVIFSQLRACSKFGKDSVCNHYIANLLRWVFRRD